MLKHVDAYFEHFFHMPCMGVLHEPTIYRLIEEDNLSPDLAAAVCSITATLVSTVSAGQTLAALCNESVEYYLFRNLGLMEPELLTFYVLTSMYNWMSGPWSKVWMNISTAARLIRCLQLNYDPEYKNGAGQVSATQQEIQRRSVWHIYLIDHFLSSGHDEHVLLQSDLMHLRLPCSDQSFRDGSPSPVKLINGDPFSSTSLTDQSLNAYHVRILTIRSHILR